MSDKKFKNFAVLTLDIQSVEVKESRKGSSYAVAQAALPMGEEYPPMPFRVIVTNGLTKVLKAGTTMTLVGHIGYEEKDGGGKEHRDAVYLFFPYKFEAPEKFNGKAIARNFVQLTLRSGKQAECRYSDAGIFWGHARMALGTGKDEKGEYKPSLWLTVKAFSHEDDETLPQKLASVAKGSLATVSGRLIYETFTDKVGKLRVSAGLVASKIGDFEGGIEVERREAVGKKFEEPNFV